MLERMDKIFNVLAAIIRDGFSVQELIMYGLTLTALVLIIWLSMGVIKKLLDIILQIVSIVKVPITALERIITSFFSGIGKLCSSFSQIDTSTNQPPPPTE